MVQRVWKSITLHWHIFFFIVSTFVAAVIWVKDVSSYGGRLSAVEQSQQSQDERLTRMDYNVQMIARKVGVKPLERPNNGQP